MVLVFNIDIEVLKESITIINEGFGVVRDLLEDEQQYDRDQIYELDRKGLHNAGYLEYCRAAREQATYEYNNIYNSKQAVNEREESTLRGQLWYKGIVERVRQEVLQSRSEMLKGITSKEESYMITAEDESNVCRQFVISQRPLHSQQLIERSKIESSYQNATEDLQLLVDMTLSAHTHNETTRIRLLSLIISSLTHDEHTARCSLVVTENQIITALERHFRDDTSACSAIMKSRVVAIKRLFSCEGNHRECHITTYDTEMMLQLSIFQNLHRQHVIELESAAAMGLSLLKQELCELQQWVRDLQESIIALQQLQLRERLQIDWYQTERWQEVLDYQINNFP